MKKQNMLLAMGLTGMLALGCLGGCGDTGKGSAGADAGAGTGGGTPQSGTEEEPASSGNEDSAPASVSGKLDVWVISGGTDTDGYYEAFGEAYPDIDYNVTFYADDDLKTQSKIALDSGVVPDMMVGHAGTDFQQYYDSGMLMDITGIVEEMKLTDTISQSYFDAYMVDGKYYGVPCGGLQPWQTLYVNRDIFDACGITEDPVHVEDLIQISATLRENGYAPLAIGNKDLWPAVILFGDYYAQQTDGRGICDDIMAGKETFTDSEVMRKALETIVAYGQNGVYMPGFATTDHNTAIQTFATGQAAMLYCGSWWSGQAPVESLDFEIDCIRLPLIEGLTDYGSVQASIDVAMLFTKDADEEAVKAFLEYMTREEWYVTYGTEQNALTVSAEANEKVDIAEVFLDDDLLRQLDKPAIYPYFDWMFPDAVTTAMKENFQKAISGDVTVDEALANIQAVMDENIVAE